MGEESLRKAGLRITTPRLQVLDMLKSNAAAHLSAEEIYRRILALGKQISLATIYRVLADFESAQLLKRHNFEGDSAVFELDHGEHHDHLVCVHCQKVTEFCDETIESRLVDLTEHANFHMVEHTLTIYGVCAGCGPVK